MAGNLDFFTNTSGKEAPQKQVPFYKIKDEKESRILQWLKNEVIIRKKAHEPFFKKCRRNLLCYKNEYYKVQGNKRQSESLEYVPHQKTSKYTVNHLYEMTENLVSRMTRLKPAVVARLRTLAATVSRVIRLERPSAFARCSAICMYWLSLIAF